MYFILKEGKKTQVSINRLIDGQILFYLHNEVLLNNIKEWIIDAYNHMDKMQIHCAEWKKPGLKRKRKTTYWVFIISLA